MLSQINNFLRSDYVAFICNTNTPLLNAISSTVNEKRIFFHPMDILQRINPDTHISIHTYIRAYMHIHRLTGNIVKHLIILKFVTYQDLTWEQIQFSNFQPPLHYLQHAQHKQTCFVFQIFRPNEQNRLFIVSCTLAHTTFTDSRHHEI